MKKLISFLILAVLIVSGCSRSAETVAPETAADLPDRITLETITQEETTTEEKETVLETEESELQEEESETETIEEFDDSISETCEHNFEFSDTYIEELEDNAWKDLYICPKCGAGYSVPHVFDEEVSEETDCSHDVIVDGVCRECGMDGLEDIE